ncbi:unnamed protein product, partial [Cladocopium goreaui]
ETEFVVTYVHGLETMNTADPGDYVCLGPQGEEYVVKSDVAPFKFYTDEAKDIPA